MKIDFTEEIIEGEPGPNLYVFGSQSDYKQLIHEIKKLRQQTRFKFELSSEAVADSAIERIFIIRDNDKSHVSRQDKSLYFYLDEKHLNDFEQTVLGLSQRTVHDYVDWEIHGMNFNLIISSEW